MKKSLLLSFGIFFLCVANLFGAVLGDLDNSTTIDLKDVVLSLQICSGLKPSSAGIQSDVNNDGKIDLAETIYNLQIIANIREKLTVWYKDGDGYSNGTNIISVNRPSLIYFKEQELITISGDTDDNNPSVHPPINEIDRVQAAVQTTGASWTAASNPIAVLSKEERKNRLGYISADSDKKTSDGYLHVFSYRHLLTGEIITEIS